MENKKNKEELENIKKQYNKYMKFIKFVFLIILIALIIFILSFLYKLFIVNKFMDANIIEDSTEGYKVTYYNDDTGEILTTRYFKNRVQKYTYDDSDIYFTPEGTYISTILNNEKAYHFQENILGNESSKYLDISDAYYGTSYIYNKTNSKIRRFISISRNPNQLKIRFENYKGNKYITIDQENFKYWLNPKTYVVCFIKTTSPKMMSRIEIEKGTVADEEIALPDPNIYKIIKENN